jgi:NADH dehydrogenase
LRLARRLRGRRDVDVTLISRENFFLLTPMLPQVAASGIDTRHIVAPIRQICPTVRFFEAEIEKIDLAARTVSFAHADGPRMQLGYDHVVIALGGVTNFFGIPGAQSHAITIKTLGDAIVLRNRALDMLEQAEIETNDERRRTLLSFAVIGAGFAGVETAAELNGFLRKAARFYHRFKASDISVMLVDGGPRVLPELRERLASVTQQMLARRGVICRLGVFVKTVDEGGIAFADGSRAQAATVVWAGGVGPNPLVAALPGTQRGRLVAEATLAVDGLSGVWAIGDCALIRPPGSEKPYPPTAQHAVRMGPHVADNIVAAIEGRPLRPFVYSMLGQMANLGDREAVAMIGGVGLTGFWAWWLWRTYYLLRLPTFERKLRVAIDWTLDLIFPRDVVKLSLWDRRPTTASASHRSES